jgi:alpha-glucosidase
MQWDTTKNAGFSKADKTWLPVPPSYNQRNVEVEKKDPNSLFNWYKQLIALRKSNAAIRDGEYVTLNPDDRNVFSFLRKSESGNAVLVALNMSSLEQKANYNLHEQGIEGLTATPLLVAPRKHPKQQLSHAGQVALFRPVRLSNVVLPPFGVFIAEVK